MWYPRLRKSGDSPYAFHLLGDGDRAKCGRIQLNTSGGKPDPSVKCKACLRSEQPRQLSDEMRRLLGVDRHEDVS